MFIKCRGYPYFFAGMMLNKITPLTHPFQVAWHRDTWQTLEQCDVLLLRHDGSCGYEYGGKAYSPLYDSLGDLFVKRGLFVRSVATGFAKLTGVKAHNNPVSYNRAALIHAIVRRIGTKGMAWVNKQRQHLWERILDRAKPCCVIGCQPHPSLCRAGKLKKIPVYDFQHGLISDEHPWYGVKYRSDIPSIDLPDGFLCWDELSAAALRKWAPQKGIDVRVVGNPWFLRFLIKDPDDSLVVESLMKMKIFNDAKPVIMVTLQWGMDFYYKKRGFNGVMADALEKTILETAETYNWLLRLHPLQLRGPEKNMVQNYLVRTFGKIPAIEWKKCSEMPLPIVLQEVDLHITDMSTVVVEAGWMGIHSALLNSHICPGGMLEKIYYYERSLGLADVLKQDKNIIKQWITEKQRQSKGMSTMNDYNQALHAFIDEIVASVEINRKLT